MSGTQTPLIWNGATNDPLEGSTYTDGTNNNLSPSSSSELDFVGQSSQTITSMQDLTLGDLVVQAQGAPSSVWTFSSGATARTITLNSANVTDATVTQSSRETWTVTPNMSGLTAYFPGLSVRSTNSNASLTIAGNVVTALNAQGNPQGSQAVVEGSSTTVAAMNVAGPGSLQFTPQLQLSAVTIGIAGMAKLNLTNAAFASFGDLRVATGTGSTATVVVDASELNVQPVAGQSQSLGQIVVGGSFAGQPSPGTATVTVSNSGSIVATSVAVNAGSSVDVGGSGSSVRVTTLDISGGSVSTHDGGNVVTSALQLDPGATMSVGVGTTVTADTLAAAGQILTDSLSHITLNDKGTTQPGMLTATVDTLALAGVTLQSDTLHLDAGTNLTAANSDLTIAGTATIGNGTLTLRNDATFSAQSLSVGSGAALLDAGSANVSTLTNAGSIVVNAGATLSAASETQTGNGILTINGGQFSVGGAPLSGIAFGDTTGGVLRETGASGDSTIGHFQIGDSVVLQGNLTAAVNSNTVTLSNGATFTFGLDTTTELVTTVNGSGSSASLVITADAAPTPTPAPTSTPDPSNSTTPQPGPSTPVSPTDGSATETLYRFFDTQNGLHFYTASVQEEQSILQNRPEFVLETTSSLTAAMPDADPNAQAVYRFFDLHDGSYFFTTNSAEKNALVDPSSPSHRTDLVFESGSTFFEHTTAQAGDTAVYRYFDSNNGSHLYTDSSSERAAIGATRPDLVNEGVAFYEPAKAAA